MTTNRNLTPKWFELERQVTLDNQEIEFLHSVIRSGVSRDEVREANQKVQHLQAGIDDAIAEMVEIEGGT